MCAAIWRHPEALSAVRRSDKRSSTLRDAFLIILVHGSWQPDGGTHVRLCISSSIEGLSSADIELPVCYFSYLIRLLALNNALSSSDAVPTRLLEESCCCTEGTPAQARFAPRAWVYSTTARQAFRVPLKRRRDCIGPAEHGITAGLLTRTLQQLNMAF